MVGYRQLTAANIVHGVREGKFSAVEVAKAALELAATEGKDLNAFITVCDRKALDQARRIDSLTKENKSTLPLCGVPVAIKDNISYRDYPTTCASKILKDYVPPYDATVLDRLVQGGAVIIGKTNMDEFAMGSSNETSFFGPVRNPVDHALTPGGSSGGSAAAVARQIVPIALGSETGGSIRQPAAFCGVLGLKPTYGAVSRYGLAAYCSSTDQISACARTAEDLALVYSVICGHDPRDATSVAYDHPDYLGSLESNENFKIGLIVECMSDGLHADIEKAVRQSIHALKGMGHEVTEVSLPTIEYSVAFHYIIAPAEASANLARYDGVRYGLRSGGETSLDDMYTQTRTEGFGPEVQRRVMLGTYALTVGHYDSYYLKAMKVRELMCREFDRVFKEVDVLISPTSPTPAFRLGEKLMDPLTMYLSDIYTIPASQAGIPAISIPFGAAPDGRPVAVQLMAPVFKETSLFQLTRQLEQYH
jgi:aspartyl-tRNA(Asn)/glutamyl-tRNA(Gln) amidotransferase subunit A